MAKRVDALVLETSAERCVGSTPTTRTISISRVASADRASSRKEGRWFESISERPIDKKENALYNREIETDPAKAAQHNEVNKARAARRLAEVAAKKKAKRGK